MTTAERALLVFAALLLATAILGLANVHRLHAWERSAGYPYGMLCDVYRNC